MKVFLAGVMQGSIAEARIHNQDWREPIKAILARHLPDAEVYCHYTQHPNSLGYEFPEIVATFTDGVVHAAECDVLIAYLPTASMGTAIEMYEAARRGAAVLAITPMAANWVIRIYSDRIFCTTVELEEFLTNGELPALIAKKRQDRQMLTARDLRG